jgi:hypothetical protein
MNLKPNNMTAKIFAYKGNIGIDIDMDGTFLNDPKGKGQLGCVISTKEVEISPEAIELIKSAKRGGGSFSELMLTKHANGDGFSSIGVMGFGKIHLGKEFEIGRTCDTSILADCSVGESEAPEDYRNFIDELSN